MDILYLIKPGEILLKKENQREFSRRLIQELKARLSPISVRIEEFPGRFFLFVDETKAERCEFVLSHCPGLNGFARTRLCLKNYAPILDAALAEASQRAAEGKRSFKVEVRRSDKSFPLGSYELAAKLGEEILNAEPSLRVDVHKPDFVVAIEIRERAYVYSQNIPGPRGLPTGSSAKLLLLLSGGIDSPVAGYMMALRGSPIECIHFHSYPYTSKEAQEKVEKLALALTAWCGHTRLWMLPFTDVQMAIKRSAPEETSTLMFRSAMMEAAGILAERIGAKALVTGESLGQVASQTAEAMALTQSSLDIPVFRPLVGLDKEQTVGLATKIGTFELSTLPYEDCCVLFSPPHPLLKPDLKKGESLYGSLGLRPLIEESLRGAEKRSFNYKDIG
ncbi:MAG: tRNA 4-thiouridine(8) synthase ThiI [Spirochaetia bacterium]|jgi:thiamine biosynthesis protein ThiI|uniref:Putative tRNA sulfurtransferase n=1 Tax=bioreactor metagenome TaxID=1076179 RepID=A0A644THR3_9ZZZZ|nr:tRNA 4-thiouridine(8) synthase ThiI [Spirochaetia bacterium]MCE1207968.1 tRNA 4-thiouridine(8) synthase ThiI [Spirochaetia bacterium]VBB40765.1 putative tRNA sulfurtransferase [uncultured Spirochaetota bacterium]HOI23579.1 tRNA uracil 4-sulfurtransferase ThiI [Spirochaetales bacterium]